MSIYAIVIILYKYFVTFFFIMEPVDLQHKIQFSGVAPARPET